VAVGLGRLAAAGHLGCRGLGGGEGNSQRESKRERGLQRRQTRCEVHADPPQRMRTNRMRYQTVRRRVNTTCRNTSRLSPQVGAWPTGRSARCATDRPSGPDPFVDPCLGTLLERVPMRTRRMVCLAMLVVIAESAWPRAPLADEAEPVRPTLQKTTVHGDLPD